MSRLLLSQPVYLVDFSVYKPPEELKMDLDEALHCSKNWSMYNESSKDFMVKVFAKSGISPTGTYLPAAINPLIAKEPCNSIPAALEEARMVMTGAVSDLLEKTGTRPGEIDILITNCSIFCPTPSLSSMLVNHFKFKKNIQSYNLGGMGCGNGVVAVNLVRDLLQAHPGSKALFVPAEITTYCFYPGADNTFMVANCIFRMGGAAALFSNESSRRSSAKYQLLHAERVHTGQDAASYSCMAWRPDPTGVNGVYLGRDVVQHAGVALQHCLEEVAPRVLTWRQYGEAACNTFQRKVLGRRDVGRYSPEFADSIVRHFAIHAGGYAVLKGIQDGMKLPNGKMLPSFAALREYGNTSCSTTWYVMAYMETCDSVKKGEVVMQIGMGGGMKAGVNIWRALRDNHSTHTAWRHLQLSPLTEADLPRAMDDRAAAAKPPATAAAARLPPMAKKASVARRPTLDIYAVHEGIEETAH